MAVNKNKTKYAWSKSSVIIISYGGYPSHFKRYSYCFFFGLNLLETIFSTTNSSSVSVPPFSTYNIEHTIQQQYKTNIQQIILK